MRYLLQISISLLFIFVVNVHAQKVVSIDGRVIDSKGKSVVGALVTYYIPLPTSYYEDDWVDIWCRFYVLFPSPDPICDDRGSDHIIPTGETIRDGVFFMDLEIGKENKEIEVLIEKLAPKHIWKPVMLEIDERIFINEYKRKRFPEFTGIIRKIPKSGNIHIGETSKYLWYRTISLDPLKLFGKQVDIEKILPILINIKYKDVYFVKDEVVSKKAIDKGDNRVEFALPQGTWELFLRTKDKKISGKAIAVIGDEVEIFYRDIGM